MVLIDQRAWVNSESSALSVCGYYKDVSTMLGPAYVSCDWGNMKVFICNSRVSSLLDVEDRRLAGTLELPFVVI
jgi:hypothetical protein